MARNLADGVEDDVVEFGGLSTVVVPSVDLRVNPHRLARGRRIARHLPWTLLLVDLVVASIATLVLAGAAAVPVLVPAWLVVVAVFGCYRTRVLDSLGSDLRSLVEATLAMVLVVELALLAGLPADRGPLLIAVVITAGVGLVTRGGWWLAGRLGVRDAAPRVVVVGDEAGIERVLGSLSNRNSKLAPVGACVVSGGDDRVEFDDILAAVQRCEADAVLAIPGPTLDPIVMRRLAWSLESTQTELLVLPGLSHVVPSRAELAPAGTMTVVHVRRAPLDGPRRAAKDVVERVAAAGTLVLLAPVLAVVALAVRFDSSGPALFRQSRVGRDGRQFTMFKFRTMVTDAEQSLNTIREQNEADAVLFKMRRDPRITRVGEWLRRYSVDEIPQLWNVVRGDMSLVGPRPPLPSEVDNYEHDVHRRMAVKPGLTGLWQVSGRSDLTWEEAVRLDLHYVDNWSLSLDAAIVVRTVRAVVGHRGAY